MTFKRYPYQATIEWTMPGAYNTFGVYVPGTLTTLGIYCNAQPSVGRYVAKEGGDRIPVALDIFTPTITTTIPDGARLLFKSRRYVILAIDTYQTHTEIRC